MFHKSLSFATIQLTATFLQISLAFKEAGKENAKRKKRKRKEWRMTEEKMEPNRDSMQTERQKDRARQRERGREKEEGVTDGSKVVGPAHTTNNKSCLGQVVSAGCGKKKTDVSGLDMCLRE